PEAWLPQQLFQMLRRQVAGQVKVARQQARGNCGCTQTEAELNFLTRGSSPLPIVIAAFQNDSPWLVYGQTERTCSYRERVSFLLSISCARDASLIIRQQGWLYRKSTGQL